MMTGTVAFGEERIKVTVDGKEITFDQEPVIENGRVLVPFRAIFEELDCNVDYDERTNSVHAKKGERSVSLKIGDDNMIVGKLDEADTVELDVAPQIINGRTMVPVRAIAEGMDAAVRWNEDERTVTIETKQGEHIITSAKLDAVIKSKDGTGIVDYYCSYPVIDNPENDPFIKAINDTYKKEADVFYNKVKTEYMVDAEMLHESIAAHADMGEVRSVKYPLMEFSLDYTVTVDRNDLLSITQVYYYDFAGAHPTTERASRTFDLKEGKQLMLEDMLNGSEAEIDRAIIKAFDTYLNEEFGDEKEYASMIKEDMEKEIDNVGYYVDDHGIVVYYQVYQVGPYAMGYPQVRINYENNEHNFNIDLSGAAVESINLELTGNPTTGYQWIITEQSDNIEIISSYEMMPGAEKMLGKGGKYVFKVIGIEEGNAGFEIEYKRAWSNEVSRKVKYDLYINKDKTITIINSVEE